MKAFKKNKDNLLLLLRMQLGLSQEQMAIHIGMGYTSYKMAETGRRPVSTAALIQIAGLEIQLKEKLQRQGPFKPHPLEARFTSRYRGELELLFGKELIYRKQVLGLQRRLERLRGHYKKCREWLDVLDALAHEQENDVAVKQREKQQQAAIKKLERCNMPVQRLLKIKIELLEAEANLYQTMQEKLREEIPEFFREEDKQAIVNGQ